MRIFLSYGFNAALSASLSTDSYISALDLNGPRLMSLPPIVG